jgi:plasmid stability protein
MQYTIRDIPEDVDKALRAKAKAEGKSLNQTTVEVLTAAVGIGQAKRKYRDLSDLVGSMIRDPEFDRVMEEQDQIDPEIWK